MDNDFKKDAQEAIRRNLEFLGYKGKPTGKQLDAIHDYIVFLLSGYRDQINNMSPWERVKFAVTGSLGQEEDDVV